MHASQMAEEYPVVGMDTDALDAARLLAEHRLPGILVTNPDGSPEAVLPASQVVRFLVPRYVQDDPSLAGVLSESVCDQAVTRLRGKKVRDVIPERLAKVPAAKADDTIIEVAATMARFRSPLVAVVKDSELIGVITASRLLAAALQHS
ncbi:CBS domain-containing protein [Nocardia sp. CDC159]|uniref:CBS domain-containing protein n=1 Tax=Nocardia pulmonis TaxID=2951408 RepID=A0A9X2EEJ5_9NOCA|nr:MULTISPECIES: CBS domain-containing protein [Nocardia]MCM6778956.1 CBS domain-containing protein [Nocardia pulmonis]MCM6791845.1 CBS domain-containing protein [Nocardia sp. CDC159]